MGSEFASSEPVCSIDRVTFLIKCPKFNCIDEIDFHESQRKKMKIIEQFFWEVWKDHYQMFDERFPNGSKSKCYMKHMRTVSGIDFQFAPIYPIKKKIGQTIIEEEDEDQNIIEIVKNEYSYYEPDYSLRFEYNPNKQDILSIKPLRDSFKHYLLEMNQSNLKQMIKISRIDVAVDYPVEIDPCFILADKMQTCFTASNSKQGIKTVYFGRRASKNYFRIYDKRYELLREQNIAINNPLWRIELEHKEPFFINEKPIHLYDVFKRLRLFSTVQKTGDFNFDNFLFKVQHFGLKAVLSEAPERTAYRYKSRMQECQLNIEYPAEVFRLSGLKPWDVEKQKILGLFGLDESNLSGAVS
jgi:hypothetical protein